MNDYNPLSSIEQLMEFGMGMAVAQQMISTMNHCMASVQVPGQVGVTPAAAVPATIGPTRALTAPAAAVPAPAPPPAVGYHLCVNGTVAGPFALTELDTLAKARTLTADTLVWKPGMAGWTQAQYVAEVSSRLLPNVPPIQPTA